MPDSGKIGMPPDPQQLSRNLIGRQHKINAAGIKRAFRHSVILCSFILRKDYAALSFNSPYSIEPSDPDPDRITAIALFLRS